MPDYQLRQVFSAQGANKTVTIDTAKYQECVISCVKNTGSPDGTFNAYTVPDPNTATVGRVAVATYATPSTIKTWTGPTAGGLVIELTGNSTGSIDAWVQIR